MENRDESADIAPMAAYEIDPQTSVPEVRIQAENEIPKTPGTYLLFLRFSGHARISVGRLGTSDFVPGFYGYVGSARGPGGLAARLRRHAVKTGSCHWHIDYLLPQSEIAGAVFAETKTRLECDWAGWAQNFARCEVTGFGASDCTCRAHLFFFGKIPDEVPLIQQARKDLHALYASRQLLLAC
ncbi:MAG: GIY-YIG nuclease family protein [Desulfobacterales bacterium]|nr:GIY-YIG nuclease family protein [Desulfobacterales bacterium]